MMTQFKISGSLLATAHRDLDRIHDFALERVGFFTCNVADLADGGISLYAATYHIVADEDYLSDSSAAAVIGPGAFRKILQNVYNKPAAVVHVHRHDHIGPPRPSHIDISESRRFVPDFWKVCPNHPHGVLILSLDAMYGLLWHSDRSRISPFDTCVVVGDPLKTTRGTGA